MTNLHTSIQDAYAEVASSNGERGCCGTNPGCCGSTNGVTMAPDYRNIKGYQENTDLWLGCGIPTWIAHIREWDTVVDLGSGAGNDAFIVRRLVGETGKVIWIDMTPEMIALAQKNATTLGFSNVEFQEWKIEDVTRYIEASSVDVIVSNCVLNLLPNKEHIFSDIYTLLKNGWHFSISDIVYIGNMPEWIKKVAELFAGCISGATQKNSYLRLIEKAWFKNIEVKKENEITLTDTFLWEYLNANEIVEFRLSKSGIYSVTIYAEKGINS